VCLVRLSIRSGVSSQTRRSLAFAACLAVGSVLLFVTGCQLPAPRPPGPPVDPASLAPQYPGIEFGGAQTLADFQNSAQLQWFAVASGAEESDATAMPDANTSKLPQPTLETPPDGPDDARSLKFDLTSAADRLVFDLTRAATAGMTRDWSDFGALLLRISGPPDGADANVTLRSGGAAGFGELSFAIHLASGWNLLTADLDAMSRGAERHDIRQLEIALVLGSKPATFYLDDIVLADHVRWYTGQDGRPEKLYAYARGPRVFAGVRDRFELVFAEAAISAWFTAGPENLAGRSGLGPWPVFVANDWSGRAEDSGRSLRFASPHEPGLRPAASQRIVEASPVRIVLEGQRELLLGESVAETSGAAELRRGSMHFVIYPDGRVFVRSDLDAGPSAWPLSRLAWGLLLNSGTAFALSQRPSAAPDHDPANFVLLTRTPPGDELLWVSHLPDGMRWRRILPEIGGRSATVLAGETPTEPVMSGAHLLWFGPAELDVDRAEAVASDYQEPLALKPDAGTLVTDAPGDINRDGYNESEGCYELSLQRGRLRFVYDPGSLPRQGPLFRLTGSEQARCWIYANGQALPSAARDAAGRALFALPGIIRTPRLIEVYAETADGA
jgi:hypothetical protein